jgi:hypothetical protein
MACVNPAPGTQLASACACQAGVDALTSQVTAYTSALADYKTNNDLYNKYISDKSVWQNRYDTEKASFTASIVGSSTCAPAGNCNASNCPDGYHNNGEYQGYANNCDIGLIQSGCRSNCSPNSDTIDSHMGTWTQNNPPPATVPQPQQPTAPGGSNIQCCSQIFQGIKADSVDFSGLVQKCTQQINDQIKQATGTGAETGTGNTTINTSSNSKYTTYYIIGGIVLLLIIILLLS